MKQWTHHAEQRLVEYLRERVAREGLVGEEAEEIKADLRSHIHEEAERSPSTSIGLMELESILGRLDSGYVPPVERPPVRPSKGGAFRKFLRWTFGVVMPAAVLVFESVANFCGGVFFDPVPTWWHVAWIALVPGVNAWLLTGGRGGGDRSRGTAAGFTLVTAVFYGLLFLPLIHLSALALLIIGMGLLSLTPVFAAITTWRIGRAANSAAGSPAEFRAGWRAGVLASLLVLCALEAPALWTRANLTVAAEDGAGAPAAIARLRAFHSERVLLKACYEGNRGTQLGTDIAGWLLTGWRIPAAMIDETAFRSLDSEKVRDIFFRVTGVPFNTLKPPSSARGGRLSGRGDPLEDIEFDDHLGGDDVAVRLKHLDLAQSRFDGHIDAASQTGYGEWTMVFKNSSGEPKEARCQVRLPRGGHVSRLTLWVNGEPQEAAFSTVSKVKAAYKAIAVVQRRDPVLVNVVGPDTVMVQCFPVPSHGEMKIRFGVTAPLDDGRWRLPHIIERNFGTARTLEHAVWLQGSLPFNLTDGAKTHAAQRDGDGHSLPVTLDGTATLRAGAAVVAGPLPAEPAVVWCEDRFAKPEERFLVREPVTKSLPAADRIVVVVDGSGSLAGFKEPVIRSIREAGEDRITLLLADDHVRPVGLKELGNHAFTGGRDNEAALREGIRIARETGAPVVWIHGPQAVKLSQSEALMQLLERGTVRPVIHEVEAGSGPNRLAEAIFRSGCLRSGPGLAGSGSGLAAFLSDLTRPREERSWNWKRLPAAPAEGRQTWDQLARMWAAATVEDPPAAMTDAARAELAARYQLVTLFSGAVVLETKQQYADHGLEQADGNASPHIPNVPETSTSLLLLVAAASMLFRRKRHA